MDGSSREKVNVRLLCDGVVPIQRQVKYLHSLVISTYKDLSATYLLDADNVSIRHGSYLGLLGDGIIEYLEYSDVTTILLSMDNISII